MLYQTITPTCALQVADDADVAVWCGTQGLDRKLVRSSICKTLGVLDGEWTFELHQFLANSGLSVLLFGLQQNPKADGSMPLSLGSIRGSFGEGMVLGTTVTSEDRIQFGISVLTAFAVHLTVGTEPEAVDMQAVAERMSSLELPLD